MIKSLQISFFLAWKSISRTGRGTSILIVCIMTLAFINIVLIPSMLLGVMNSMNEEAINNLYGNIVIEPGEGESAILDVTAMQAAIDGTEGIVASSAHTVTGAELSYDENNDGQGIRTGSWAIKSIDPSQEKKVTQIQNAMVAGEYLHQSDSGEILVGREITGGYGSIEERRSLKGLKVGDVVTATFSNGGKKLFTVKGIFGTKSIEANLYAFITQADMDAITKTANQASEIIVKTSDTGKESLHVDALKKKSILGNKSIKAWNTYVGITASVTESFALINLIIGTVGFLIAAVAIFIVIFINIVNKRKQIGILKAIGARKHEIIGSYIIHSLLFALLGIGLGSLVIFFGIKPYFIAHPIEFPIGWARLAITGNNYAISAIGLIIASLIGGLIPSWRAAREKILKAIQGI